MPRRCRFWRPRNMPPCSDLRSDYPLNFTCFRPSHQSVLACLYDLAPPSTNSGVVPGYAFLTWRYGRHTHEFQRTGYLHMRSAQSVGSLTEDVVRPAGRRTATNLSLVANAKTHQFKNEYSSESWLTVSSCSQMQRRMNAVWKRSRAQLLRMLALHLDIEPCIAKFYLNDVFVVEDNSAASLSHTNLHANEDYNCCESQQLSGIAF